MHSRSIEAQAFISIVTKALVGAHCCSAWAGYGNALYIGFDLPGGSTPGTPGSPSRRRELSTAFCNWNILQGQQVLCTDDDTRDAVLNGLSQLISQTVIGLEVERSTWLLQAAFSNGLLLQLSPYNLEELDAEDGETDAWVLQEGEIYYSVSCAGGLTESNY
jgi:hypothetical protein